MNMILGGQFTSRINLNLREAKGFTYGATYQAAAGKFRSVRKILNSTLPMGLKEGMMVIAKKMD